MKRIAAILILTIGLGVAACAPVTPSAADRKAQCFTNQALIRAEMDVFQADSGIYPPIATVVEKMHLKCPSGGTYSFDETSATVSCSVHGHP
jgi:hypothetical protein